MRVLGYGGLKESKVIVSWNYLEYFVEEVGIEVL